jgi:hypothetical protein
MAGFGPDRCLRYRAPTKTTPIHELERYMRVQGVFTNIHLIALRATNYGERSALDLVAGPAVNVKQEWERAKKLFRS